MKPKLRILGLLLAVGISFSAGLIFAQSRSQALEAPRLATTNPKSVEVLRVWASPDGSQDLTLRTNWNDPAAWGLLLVDIARHASRAYAANGLDEKRVLSRIKAGFDAEWSNPTDVQPPKKGR
jgi:uncharacterized protein DUF5076